MTGGDSKQTKRSDVRHRRPSCHRRTFVSGQVIGGYLEATESQQVSLAMQGGEMALPRDDEAEEEVSESDEKWSRHANTRFMRYEYVSSGIENGYGRWWSAMGSSGGTSDEQYDDWTDSSSVEHESVSESE